MRSLLAPIVLFCCLWSAPLAGQVLQTRVVADDLGIPWEILWGPDNMIWMTERQGRVSRLDPETGAIQVLATLPQVKQINEGGLLGMALHPNFAVTPYIYLAYTYDFGGATRVRLERYTYQNNMLVAPVILIDNIEGASIHDGCRLLFAPDNTLLITTGDAANQSLPQDHASLNGKILRINPDGSIPADNPWPDSRLYTTGHRNPQGLCFGPDGKLYSSEHGPSTDDEVNLIQPGRNYGWPEVHGYCNLPAEQAFCADSNVVEPLTAWTPTLAVCGMEYYNHAAIPAWRGSLLVVTLKASRLLSLRLNNDGTEIIGEEEYLANTFGRLRDICIAPDGRVFISTSNSSNNKVIEITAVPLVSEKLTASVDTLDFGPVRIGMNAERELTFTNAGSTTATVIDLSITGETAFIIDNTTHPPLPFTLTPGQNVTLTVRFAPVSPGRSNAVLTVSTPLQNEAATVYLTGTGIQPELDMTDTVDVGVVAVGSSRDTTVSALLLNTGTTAVTVTALEIVPPSVFVIKDIPALPRVLPEGQSLDLSVSFAPQQEGTHTAMLIAQYDGMHDTTILIGRTGTSTSVEDVPPENQAISITPNPAQERVLFSLRTGVNVPAHIAIADMTGRTVWEGKTSAEDDILTIVWNGRDGSGRLCPPGVYSVSITAGQERYTSLFVLLRQ